LRDSGSVVLFPSARSSLIFERKQDYGSGFRLKINPTSQTPTTERAAGDMATLRAAAVA
jgi:hypothetical protein